MALLSGKLAWRELINNRRFSILFILSISLGLSGFTFLDAFRDSLKDELRAGSRRFLGADVAVSVRNREFSKSERNLIFDRLPEKSRWSETYTMISMAAVPSAERSRIVSLMAIGNRSPLYGSVSLKNSGTIDSDSPKEVFAGPVAWTDPELVEQMQIDVGDNFKVGELSLQVRDIIVDDSRNRGSALQLAPVVYLSIQSLKQTGLIRPGSRYRQSINLRLPPEIDEKSFAEELKSVFRDPEVSIQSHQEASDNLGRALTYMTDYLGLVALIALFLAGVGSSYLCRSLLISRVKEMAVLISLGNTPSEARMVYVWLLVFLGVLGAVFSLVLASLVFPLVPDWTSQYLPVVLEPSLNIRVISVTLLVGVLGSLLICLPLFDQISRWKPTILFQDSVPVSDGGVMRSLFFLLPAILLFWGLSVWESTSFVVGSIFVLVFFVSVSLLVVIGRFLFFVFGVMRIQSLLSLKWALQYLSYPSLATLTSFVALSLGAMLLSLIPQLRHVVISEIEQPKDSELPSLFLVDIQDDQLTSVEEVLAQNGAVFSNASPLVRARLREVNGVKVERVSSDVGLRMRTREDDRRKWVRSRGQNLSYAKELNSSETIIRGRAFAKKTYDPSQGLAEISMEMRYARRLGVDLGDTLSFSIEGVPVEGVIVNIRRVRWTSFQPNFFIKFQDGVLNAAPKVHIASVGAISSDKKAKIQNELVERFSNVSIVDIGQTVKRILALLNKMSWMVELMGYFALFVGVAVFYAIVNHQVQTRQRDLNLLKVMGARFRTLRASLVWEFAIIGGAASLFGVLLSFGFSFVVASQVFHSRWEPLWTPAFWVISGVTLLSIALAMLASEATLRSSPLTLLNEGH